jgi:hypothetical protein
MGQRLSVVANICNPSYLRSKGQEDCGSRLAQAKCYWDLISTNKTGSGDPVWKITKPKMAGVWVK